MGQMKKNKRHGRDRKSPKGENSKESSDRATPAPQEKPPKHQKPEEMPTGAAVPEKNEVKAEKPVVVEMKTSAEASTTHQEQKTKPQETKAPEEKVPEEKKEQQEKPKGFGPPGRRNDRRPRKNSNSTDSSASKPSVPPPRARLPTEPTSTAAPRRPSESYHEKDATSSIAAPRNTNAPPRRNSLPDGRGEGGNGARFSNSGGNGRIDDRRRDTDNWRGNGGGRNSEGPHGGQRNNQGHHGPTQDFRDSRAHGGRNRAPAEPQHPPQNSRFVGAQDYRLQKRETEEKLVVVPPLPLTTNHSVQICQDARLAPDYHGPPACDGNFVARIPNRMTQDVRQSENHGRYNTERPPMQNRGGNPHHDRHEPHLSGGRNGSFQLEFRSKNGRLNNLPPLPSLSPKEIREIPIFVPRGARRHTSQTSHDDYPPLPSKMDISQQSGSAAPSRVSSEVSVTGIVLPPSDIGTTAVNTTAHSDTASNATSGSRQKQESAADKDKNWRIPASAVPQLSVKELLSPNTPKPSKDVMVFTGSVSNLELPPQYISVNVEMGPTQVLTGIKDVLEDMMDGLPDLLDPRRRKKFALDVGEFIEDIVKHMSVVDSADVERMLNEHSDTILKESLLWLNRAFFMKCCFAGFVGHDFSDDDIPPLTGEEINWNEELEQQAKWLDRLVAARIIRQEQSQEIICKLTEIKELAKFVDEENVEELGKRNVEYALADPIVRLRFDKPVTEDEMHAIVHRSVIDDCGSYLWIADNAPHRLLGSAKIVESIILGISMKRISKDQRPCGAFMKVVPEILKSLKEEELCELAEKYADAVDTKVDNWPEVLYQGYQMNLTPTQGRRVTGKDIMAIKLLECETKEDLRIFLLMCALIGDFGFGRVPPVYDFSTDPFCTRIARVLMAFNISPEKKSLLIEVLLSLPPAIRSRLLAEDGFPEGTSLYFTVKAMISTSGNIPHLEFKKAAANVIQELTKTLSPARIIAHAVLPCLQESVNRMRAAAILPDLLQCEALKTDLLDGTHLTPAVLVDAALAQYEEPKGGPRGGRYGFIENILGCVDAVLEGDDVPKDTITDVETSFKKHLSWYQELIIIAVGFKKSGQKFALPEAPAVEDTLKSIEDLNLTAILGAWPDRAPVHEAFERAITVAVLNADPIKLAFVWLAAATAPNSTIKEYAPFLKMCLLKMADKAEGCDSGDAEEAEKKAEDAVSKEEKEETSWLTEELTKEDINEELRDFVLDLAMKFPSYLEESQQLEKLLKPTVVEEPPVAEADRTEAVEAAADPNPESTTDTTEGSVVVPELTAAEEAATDRLSDLIEYIDSHGERYPELLPALDHEENARSVFWLKEEACFQKPEFRNRLLNRLRDSHLPRVSMRLGGGCSGLKNKPPKDRCYLPQLPLFIEVIAHKKPEEEPGLHEKAVAKVKGIILRLERSSSSPMLFIELPGVTDEEYAEKVSNSTDHQRLKKLLKCQISTVSRGRQRNGPHDKKRPIRVKLWNAPEDVLKAAEVAIKALFGQ